MSNDLPPPNPVEEKVSAILKQPDGFALSELLQVPLQSDNPIEATQSLLNILADNG